MRVRLYGGIDVEVVVARAVAKGVEVVLRMKQREKQKRA